MGRERSYYLAALLLLILAAFLVRVASLDAQSLWRDEVDSLRFATVPGPELLSSFTRPGWNGPLYHLLLRGWIVLAGISEYAMRFFSLVFGVLGVPLIYALGKRLFSRPTGVISALLVTGSPYLVWYSQEVKMYTLVLALAMVAVYSLRRALDSGSWCWWATQFAATALALYVHILAVLLIPVQLLMCVARWSEARLRWRGVLISFAGLTLPYLPLVLWQAPLAFQARITGFSAYPLHQMIVILLNSWASGVTGWAGPWAAAPLVLLVGAALVAGTASLVPFVPSGNETESETGIAELLALVIWLFAPLLAIWVISLRQPLFTDRYLIWSAPAFYLLAARGLTPAISARTWKRVTAALTLIVVLVVYGGNLWAQATSPIKSDFRAAAAYVASYDDQAEPAERPPPSAFRAFRLYLPLVRVGQRGFEDLIIFQIPYGQHTFDYYFPTDDYAAAEGLYTNHRAPEGGYLISEHQAAWQMREMTEGYGGVWLIATEVMTWDERDLVHGWLDDHMERVDEAHFARVSVYRYVRRAP